MLGSVELLGDQAPVPPQYSLRLNDSRNFFEGFAAQLLANFGEDLSLAVGELDTSLNLVSDNTVLRYEKLVAQLQLLVDAASDVRQKSFPVQRCNLLLLQETERLVPLPWMY